jgi:acyl carrier protein phosphodiesterase
MNFLFHMLLSGNDDQLLVGNFMGDFVKGPLEGRFSERVRQGVMLHRRIDSHADRHPCFRRSRDRISPHYGLYRGVMVDLFYDYFLVNSWEDWSDESFPKYLARTRAAIESGREWLPRNMLPLVPVIFDDLLPSYRTVEGIGRALGRLSRRISRPNPLAGGEVELRRHRRSLQADFESFTPEMVRFAGEAARFMTVGGT